MKRKKQIITIFLLIVLSIIYTTIHPHAIQYFESRQGTQLNDYILDVIPSYNVALFVFLIQYISIAVFLFFNIRNYDTMVNVIAAFLILQTIRLFTIYMLPLEPPEGYVPLKDAILGAIVYSGNIYSKDLFFSGHTSAMYILYFFSRTRNQKVFHLCSLSLIIPFILVQHIHYTIDIIGAVIISYLVCYFLRRLYYYTHPEIYINANASQNKDDEFPPLWKFKL
ncbi:MAG TPA: phosphatase PAP2-related protein [Saprospiraceae bacterium]|nr:phosphatase PAP2-related protein [Saprospiraceae bacterium]